MKTLTQMYPVQLLHEQERDKPERCREMLHGTDERLPKRCHGWACRLHSPHVSVLAQSLEIYNEKGSNQL